jgi:hypothetical protein
MDWIFGILTTLHTHLLTRSNTALSLIYKVYSSPWHTHTLGFSIFTSRILATDFISLTVTTRSSFQWRRLFTAEFFSSQLHCWFSTNSQLSFNNLSTANSRTLNPILCCNCHLCRYHLFSIFFDCRLKKFPQFCLSQSHIATDGQSVSKSWCRAPSGAHDHIFITVWQSRSCFVGPSQLPEILGADPTEITVSIVMTLLTYSLTWQHVYQAVA